MPHVEDSTRPVPAHETATVAVPVDGDTLAWLTVLAKGSGMSVAGVIASMLLDIRLDDESMHATKH